MTFEETRTAIMSMSDGDKRRLILDVLPAIWPAVVEDDNCVSRLKELLDEVAVKDYKEQHMDNV